MPRRVSSSSTIRIVCAARSGLLCVSIYAAIVRSICAPGPWLSCCTKCKLRCDKLGGVSAEGGDDRGHFRRRLPHGLADVPGGRRDPAQERRVLPHPIDEHEATDILQFSLQGLQEKQPAEGGAVCDPRRRDEVV